MEKETWFDSRIEREGSRDRDERKKRKDRGERDRYLRRGKRIRVYEDNGKDRRRFEEDGKHGEGLGIGGESVNKVAKHEPRNVTGLTAKNVEAVKQLAAKIPKPPSKVIHVLRLDAMGREVDEEGKVVDIPKATTTTLTLKVNNNKNKQKKLDAFRTNVKPQLDETNPHFDPRVKGINNKNKQQQLLRRPTVMLFVEEGKWSKHAESSIKLRRSQFGEAAKAKELLKAKAKADEPDIINPNLIELGQKRVITKEKPKDVDVDVDVEWWDVPFLRNSGIDDKITIYVEHPRPIQPPAGSEPAPPPPQPLKLTKRERRKLRTQKRVAREKESQEMIRLGMLEPPKARLKMSNVMKVLGLEATQDPTKLEMEIRSAAAEREQAHRDRNIARKLTPAERCEKKARKLFDDSTTLDTIVSVYKINDLSHPQARFKVDSNAQENRLSGCAIISEGTSVVVVEGCNKSIKRYGKLMLKRIDWNATVEKEDGDENDDDEKPLNKRVLVWQGSVAKPNFSRFMVQGCTTEAAAHKIFSDHGVAHYWDLALNFTTHNAAM